MPFFTVALNCYNISNATPDNRRNNCHITERTHIPSGPNFSLSQSLIPILSRLYVLQSEAAVPTTWRHHIIIEHHSCNCDTISWKTTTTVHCNHVIEHYLLIKHHHNFVVTTALMEPWHQKTPQQSFEIKEGLSLI